MPQPTDNEILDAIDDNNYEKLCEYFAAGFLTVDRQILDKKIFHIAVESGNARALQAFLEQDGIKDEINRGDEFNRTALHLAAALPYPEIVAALLRKNADINAKDLGEKTPFEIAVELARDCAASELENRRQVSDLLFAAEEKAKTVAPTVAAVVHPKPQLPPQSPPGLAKAIKNKDFSAVNLYFATGGNPNVAVDDGQKFDTSGQRFTTLLHYAITQQSSLEIIRLIVERGANLALKDVHGRTALHFAALDKDGTVLALLLERAEVNIDEQDNYGLTALHHAAQENQIATTRLLLAKKAAVDIQDKKGCTPLHLAAFYGYSKPTELLLRANARVDITDHKGRKALKIAEESLDRADKPVETLWLKQTIRALKAAEEKTEELDQEPRRAPISHSVSSLAQRRHSLTVS